MRNKDGGKRFVLFVEGHTEKGRKAFTLKPFLKKWLDKELEGTGRVGLHVVRFEGVSEYKQKIGRSARHWLRVPDVIAAIGLVDLAGCGIAFPRNCSTTEEKLGYARRDLLARVSKPERLRFHQHFAVHEVEAWLLADTGLWPGDIRDKLPKRPPETVNMDKPPAKFLEQLYQRTYDRAYPKVKNAMNMFPKLDPYLVADKCPNFRAMVEDMKALALAAFG